MPGRDRDRQRCSLAEATVDSELEWERADGGFWYFVGDWVRRATCAQAYEGHFESLIYLWVAFNAWLGQTISNRQLATRDRRLVQTAARDARLAAAFEGMERSLPEAFRDLWPVFQTRALIDEGVEAWRGGQSRAAFRAECFAAGLATGDWSPRCFVVHQGPATGPDDFSPSRVPLDWPHTLDAIYQVRCNLFHGGKTITNPFDEEFVRLASLVLWQVWKNSGALPTHLCE